MSKLRARRTFPKPSGPRPAPAEPSRFPPEMDQAIEAVHDALRIANDFRDQILWMKARAALAADGLDWDRDRLGRAIHAAKIIGGPWGPACGVEYGDSNSDNDWACECSAMAAHLLNLMHEPSREPGEEE